MDWFSFWSHSNNYLVITFLDVSFGSFKLNLFFIFPKRFIYLFEREKDRKTGEERGIFPLLVHFPSDHMARIEPRWSRNWEASSGYLTWARGIQVLRLYPSTLLGPFSGSWSRSAELRHEPMAAALQTMPQCWLQDSLLLKLSVIVG